LFFRRPLRNSSSAPTEKPGNLPTNGVDSYHTALARVAPSPNKSKAPAPYSSSKIQNPQGSQGNLCKLHLQNPSTENRNTSSPNDSRRRQTRVPRRRQHANCLHARRQIHINSTISDAKNGARHLGLDIKNYYLGTPAIEYFQYIRVPTSVIPQEVWDDPRYSIQVADNGYAYLEIRRGMYGLKEAGIIASFQPTRQTISKPSVRAS
jgi:hypothetical protein